MPNKTYANQYFDTLIRTGKWLIEPEYGEKAFAKYMSELNLLNSGAATLKDLYGQPMAWWDDDEDEVRKKKIVRNYTDYVITVKDGKRVASQWLYDEYEEEPTPSGVIRVISFSGVMTKRGGLSTQGINSVCREFDRAYHDEGVSGIVLDLDTGGGAVQAADMLGLKIAQKNKPVVAAVTNAYSGGAWATTEADHIMGMGSTAGFGSIGVMVEFDNNDKYWEEKGWVTHRFYATKSTDKNRGYEEAIKGEYDYYRVNSLDPLCDLFIERMTKGRPLNTKDKKWQTGRTFMTKEAIAIGLCDSQGTMDDAILKCQEFANQSEDMEEQINEMYTTFQGVLSANVETGENANQVQSAANLKMNKTYAETIAAAKLRDKEVEELKQKITNLETENAKLKDETSAANTAKDEAEGKVSQLEKDLQTAKDATPEGTIEKETHDAIVQELTELKATHQTQVEYTEKLIADNNLNVSTTEQKTDEQVEETIEEEKPMTAEQKAAERIQRLTGYKGKIAMASKE
jgi:protease-4